MSYSVKVSETGDYINVDVNGDIEGEIALQFASESYKLGEETGITNIFVDLRNSRNIQLIGDKYHFVIQKLSNVPEINKGAKVTFLVDSEDHSHDFIETVMHNNGFNVSLFRDINKALKHLHSK